LANKQWLKTRRFLMRESISTTVKFQDPGNDTGDVIVELPPDVLAAWRQPVPAFAVPARYEASRVRCRRR
jgi:hypothetical protein